MTQATVLDGRKMRDNLLPGLRVRAQAIFDARKTPVGLGVILVGEDPASALYVRNKVRLAEQLGISSTVCRLDAKASTVEVLERVDAFNRLSSLDAYLVQLPLPEQIDTRAVLTRIAPERDADGITPTNQALLTTPQGVVPCTPQGCMHLIRQHRPALRGLEAVVVGRSAIVGRPMAQLLAAADATVTLCHRHTHHLLNHTRRADILVVATGVGHLVTREGIKPGATVIDVGLSHDRSQTPARLMGDVEPIGASSVAGALTPVPGGVGPMTLTMLMANTIGLAERSLNKRREF